MPSASAVKSKDERIRVVGQMLAQFAQTRIPENLPAVLELKRVFQEYIDNPDDRAGFSGTIPFPDVGKEFQYVLPMRAGNEATVRLVTPSQQQQQQQQRNGKRMVRKLTKAQQEQNQERNQENQPASSMSSDIVDSIVLNS